MPDLQLDKGGQADLVALEADRISILASVASAPGTPLSAKLEDGSAVRLKVHRCRKQEGGFLIEGRLVDATRKLREDLAARLAPASPAKPSE